MSTFTINPHGRLQEWVAEEKGYFKQAGLTDYVLQSHSLLTKETPKLEVTDGAISDNKEGNLPISTGADIKKKKLRHLPQ